MDSLAGGSPHQVPCAAPRTGNLARPSNPTVYDPSARLFLQQSTLLISESREAAFDFGGPFDWRLLSHEDYLVAALRSPELVRSPRSQDRHLPARPVAGTSLAARGRYLVRR